MLALPVSPLFQSMLTVMLLLLLGAGAIAISMGPFTDGDAAPAIIMGMTPVGIGEVTFTRVGQQL